MSISVEGKRVTILGPSFESYRSSIGAGNGQRFFVVDLRDSVWAGVGLVTADFDVSANWLDSNENDCVMWCAALGKVKPSDVAMTGNTGGIVAFYVDFDSLLMQIFHNSVWVGNYTLPSAGPWYPAVAAYNSSVEADILTDDASISYYMLKGYTPWEDVVPEEIKYGSLNQTIDGVATQLYGDRAGGIVYFDGTVFSILNPGDVGSALRISNNLIPMYEKLTHASLLERNALNAHSADAIAESATRKFITPAQIAQIGTVSQSAVLTAISAVTAKTSIVDADLMLMLDSESSLTPKKLLWSNAKSSMETYLNTKYLLKSELPAAELVTGAVTNTHLANMTGPSIKGRSTAGSGAVSDLSVAAVQSMLVDATHRFVTDVEKNTWNAKQSPATTLAGYGITDAAPLSHVGSTGTAHGVATTSVAGFLSAADKTKLDGVATGANAYAHPNHSGDVTSVGDSVTMISNNAVTNAKMAQIPTGTVKGRVSVGTGNVEDLNATQIRTLINVADGANAYVHPNHTGDVTSVADGATLIAANVVTNAKMAQVATGILKGRFNAGTGNVEDLTAAQVRSILNVADGANAYVHPANHPPSIITQDASNRFVTDAEKTTWNGKQAPATTLAGYGITDATPSSHVGATGTAHGNATTSVAGFMSSADKTKLNGVATGANAYVHPASHPPSIITQDTSNRFVTDAEKTTWNGKQAPATTLAGYGITDAAPLSHVGTTGTAHGNATTSVAGFLSAADKTKLDGIATGANAYTHPASHPPSIITQDASNRFVTDAEKTTWNGKQEPATTLAGYGITDGIKNGDVIMNTNPFGGKKLFINSFNNALFNAHLRWTVTGSLYRTSDNALVGTYTQAQLSNLFDGNYEGQLSIPADNYAVIMIDFGAGHFPGYPYGNLYISHYYTGYSQSASVRTYSNYAPHGIGWHTYNFSDFFRSDPSQLIIKARQDVYDISQMEFTIYAGSGLAAAISQIDFQLDRPGTNEMPVLDKFKANTLYFPLAMNNNRITGLATPSAATDAATKAYADSAYTHPANHPPSIITQDASNRFVTDAEKTTWNGKQAPATTLAGYGITDAAPLSHVGATGTAHGVATTSVAGFMSSADKTKLDGVATGANAYTHPANHPHSIITQDSSNRFVTDAEKATWNGKQAPATTLSGYGITDAAPLSHVGATGTAHGVATTSVAGFMSSADKTKLDGVATGANAYTHPANHPPSIITQDASNRFVTDAEKTTWNGKQAPATTLSGYGITDAAPLSHVGATGTAHGVATTSVAGFMSTADKTKLDGVATGANAYVHPNHSGDVTSVADGATTIAANVVTNTKLADMATQTFKGRNTAATGDPEDLSVTTVRTMLSITNVENKSSATIRGELTSGNVTTALGFTPENAANKNVAGGYAGLDSGGKLSASQLPALAITDTFVVATQAAMLALAAEVGDVAVRTDLSKSFILKTGGASTLANWQELLTPSDVVSSVNGMTGAVTVSTITGNAGTATKLETARTISISTDATGSASFDGSANATIALTLSNTGVTAGTYKSVTVDAKGRVTAGTNPTTLAGYGITDAVASSHVGATGTAHGVATTSVAGFMSSADKTKLDGVAAGANAYTHPANHPPSIITQDSSNRFVTDAEKATWNGKQAPATTLAGYGITDAAPSSHVGATGTAHGAATTSVAGFMSAADKTKLDGVATGATAYAHPANHPPSIITQDSSNRFVTDAEKTTWNGKQAPATTLAGYGITDAAPSSHVGATGAAHGAATTSVAGFMSSADKTKLDGVATGANAYTHPATHPPSIILQDTSNRFVTDAEKATWNGKQAPATTLAGYGITDGAPIASPAFTGIVTASKINTNRSAVAGSGIWWFSSAYPSWIDYMGQAGTANQGPSATITPPSGSLVTSWARRSFIENAAGYGWTFESGTLSATTPVIVAEIRSSDGAAKFGGAVTAPSFSGALVGNADTATKLATARSISITTDATGLTSFDGSANATIALTLANSGVTAGTYKSVTVDVKGRVTAGTNPTTLAGYGITDAAPSSHVGATGAAHGAATTSVAGFMSSADKTKLDGVATGANAYVHPNHTGDVTSVGDGALTLATVATAGTYKSVTVDVKGRVTAGTNPTTLSGYGITDALYTTYLAGRIATDANAENDTGIKAAWLQSGATNKPAGFTAGTLFSLNYSSLYGTQIAGCRATNRFFTRVQDNGTWSGWDTLATTADVAAVTTTSIGAMPTTHAANAITGLGASGTSTVVVRNDDSRLSDARTPVSHAHGGITNAGAIGTTANLPIITTTAGALTTGSFGTAANTFCQGNDARLSDARTPTAHVLNSASHTVSGLTAGHFLKALSATTFGFAAHGLTATDVGAAPSSHVGATGTAHGNATTSVAGFMSAADKTILDGATATATANKLSLRDASGNLYMYSANISIADTAAAASHYMVETGSDGFVRPKTLANVKAEVVTKAAVEAALTGSIASHSHTDVDTVDGLHARDLKIYSIAMAVALG